MALICRVSQSKYYQHPVELFSNEPWKEVSSYEDGGFWKGKVISEYDLNFSTSVYMLMDVADVTEFLVVTGAVCIMAIVACEAIPIVMANITALSYYMQNYGILNGITYWNICGASALPDGLISFIQMDLADGDPQVDDIVEMVIVADLQDGDSQLDDSILIAKNISADLINKKVVLYFLQTDAADGDLCYDDAVFSTYTYMHGQLTGSGLQTHHLIEQRFLPALQDAFPNANITAGSIISTPLNPQAHLAYTLEWKKYLPYGDSASYKIDQVILAMQEVYKNDPVMLNATEDWLRSLGAIIP